MVTPWTLLSGTEVSLGHLEGRRDQNPAARSHTSHVQTRRIICILRRGAEMKRFILAINKKWRSSRGVDIFFLPHASSIGSRLLSIAPREFINASLHGAQNSRYLTLGIALCWGQDNLPKNVLRQISRRDASNNTRKQKKNLGVFSQNESSWTVSLRKGLDTHTRNVENHNIR